MTVKKLLAKSIRADSNLNDADAFTLVGHLELGIIAAQTFQEIAPIICENLQLDFTPDELIQTVTLAIWLHDWGKANQDFQAMVHQPSSKTKLKDWYGISQKIVSNRRDKKQLIRHELLSVILAQRKPVWDWLSQAKNANLTIAILAVLGHHLKVKDHKYFSISSGELELYTAPNDFQDILKLGCKYLGLDEQIPKLIQKLPNNKLQELSCELGGKPDSWLQKLNERCKEDLNKLKKIATVKALVMASDLAASALLEKERGSFTYTDWIKDALLQGMTASELQQVIDQRLKGKELLDFQKEAANKDCRVLIVTAGCGAGKSIVPFCFFQRLAANKSLNFKVFFCYPTTATTSQGFVDYAVPTEIENKLLLHSRSWVDEQLKLKDLLDTYDGDEDDTETDTAEKFKTKVEALRIWHSKLVYCTAHTVLGLLTNHRKGLYGFPGIAQGVFIFDEIHSYPPKLFGTLLQFLRIFRKANIVLMSASLTKQQLEAIQSILTETEESATVVNGPVEIEKLPRYQLCSIQNEELPWEEVITELKVNQGKVLWITNQVADSQKIYTEAVEKFKDLPFPVKVLVYHSRFRYKDSIEQHKKLIDGFRGDVPVFAVTTQIAEMSLDISATLLVTANAPIWALIQRLGRLNRWVKINEQGQYELETARICKALIYPWWDKEPYKPDELQTGTDLVNSLQNKEINQLQLAQEMSKISLIAPPPEESEWLKTWQAYSGDLMPPSYTTQVILKEDLPKIFASANKPWLEAQKWAVSVRIQKHKTPSWERNKALKFYRVAPTEDIHYHPEIGAYEPSNKFLKEKYGHQT
jgi:CRISPR-associated endonuclease/helicase Cas3